MAVQVRRMSDNVALAPKEFNALCGTTLSWDDLFWFDWSQCVVKYQDIWDQDVYKKHILYGNEKRFMEFYQAANQYMQCAIRCYGNDDVSVWLKSANLAQRQIEQIKKLYDNGLFIVSMNLA